MNNFCLLVQILHGIKHLLKVKTCVNFWEASSRVFQLDKREEVSLLYKLEDDEENLYGAPWIRLDELAIAVPIDQIYYIRVLEMLQ